MVIFSGIQPTGRKHLGNYIGAILQYVEGQDRGEPAIYCIVDLHATTVNYDPAELRTRSQDTAALLVAAGSRPRALHPLPPGRRARAHRADLAAVGRDLVGALNRMHQFRDKSAGARERASRRAALLSRADGRRRARLPRARGAGGGGPARAHRADARRRGGLQQALRRDARGARGQHPDGRRPRARPAGAREEDVDHRRDAEGHRLRRRGARGDRQEVQERADRLGARDRARRRQARDHEPDRDPRDRARHGAGRDRARLRGQGLRRLQDRRGRGGRRVAGARARALPRAARGHGGDRGLPRDGRREGPGDRRPGSSPTCATRWALGPSEAAA